MGKWPERQQSWCGCVCIQGTVRRRRSSARRSLSGRRGDAGHSGENEKTPSRPTLDEPGARRASDGGGSPPLDGALVQPDVVRDGLSHLLRHLWVCEARLGKRVELRRGQAFEGGAGGVGHPVRQAREGRVARKVLLQHDKHVAQRPVGGCGVGAGRVGWRRGAGARRVPLGGQGARVHAAEVARVRLDGHVGAGERAKAGTLLRVAVALPAALLATLAVLSVGCVQAVDRVAEQSEVLALSAGGRGGAHVLAFAELRLGRGLQGVDGHHREVTRLQVARRGAPLARVADGRRLVERDLHAAGVAIARRAQVFEAGGAEVGLPHGQHLVHQRVGLLVKAQEGVDRAARAIVREEVAVRVRHAKVHGVGERAARVAPQLARGCEPAGRRRLHPDLRVVSGDQPAHAKHVVGSGVDLEQLAGAD
mmetsp:Transcript_34593/g.110088  ORF Transcript_34593/g.110088 Transcript_34593/m.110088 type:complete len:422 (-) Transcript_34593:484-1749(-)|eukprot:scaffold20934_cov116-Isochrysis_galbana.AAC.5